MPDPAKLRVGDRIRLLAVPQADIEQRDREIQRGHPDAGWTANAIERIIVQCPVVTIDRIDEFGMPWFDAELKDERGETEYHSLAIMDENSGSIWKHDRQHGTLAGLLRNWLRRRACDPAGRPWSSNIRVPMSKGTSGIMRSVKLLGIPLLILLLIYIGSYVLLSSGGCYEPAVIGLDGVKAYDCAPRGFVDGYVWKRWPMIIYLPLWSLDMRLWHTQEKAWSGQYHVNEVKREDIWKVYEAWGPLAAEKPPK